MAILAPLEAPDPSQCRGQAATGDVHRVATGSNVWSRSSIPRSSSRIPIVGAIVERFDAVRRADKPHAPGQNGGRSQPGKLMGIAGSGYSRPCLQPGFRGIAACYHAAHSCRHGICDQEGARVINMSFAGPYDRAADSDEEARPGVVLIAAAGNAGPKSPPLYPAHPNVIAVTHRRERQAVRPRQSRPESRLQRRRRHPGAAPNAGYQLTTGVGRCRACESVVHYQIERNPQSMSPPYGDPDVERQTRAQ
jgi:hypothetical protein